MSTANTSPTTQETPPSTGAGLPFLGNLLELARDPLEFIVRLQRDHGDYVLFSLGKGKRTLLVSDPQAIKQVLLETGKRYGKGMSTYAMRKILGNGLVVAEGDLWKRQRKLVAPAFQHHALGQYADLMVSLTQDHIAAWEDGAERDIYAEMMLLTQRIIMMALFHVDVAHDAKEAGEAFDAMMRGLSAEMSGLDALLPSFVPTPSRLQMASAVELINRRLRAIIADRAAEDDGTPDLLAALMAARDDDGEPMPEEQLLDELRTLYLAGHETTANMLSWCWLQLAQNPDACATLEEEIDRVLQGRTPTFADVQQLPYATAVLKEALRCYPAAWVHNRVANEDVQIGGYAVPAGTYIWMSPWVVQRDARWFDDPLAFAPERWLKPKAELPPADAYIPFGGGPRICIGNGFAMMEGALLLATILQRHHVQVHTGRPVQVGVAGTIYPKGGLPAKLTARNLQPA